MTRFEAPKLFGDLTCHRCLRDAGRMGAALRLVDETSSGQHLHEFTLNLASERITARELIERRVRAEVANHRPDDAVFRGLVQPSQSERMLNGFRLPEGRILDPEQQVERALAAFAANGFLLLVGDEQVEELDAEIIVADGLVVTFIKLVPLVGG